MENLDLACAELGSSLAAIGERKKVEKLVTEALSVLEDQGLYAFFLYLKARSGQPGAQISEKCHEFLKAHPAARPLLSGTERDTLRHVREALAKDLDSLLLARDLLRQALIYAQYHSKVFGAEGPGL